MDLEPEIERILALSDDEIRAETLATGECMECIAREGREILERAVIQINRQALVDRDYLRRATDEAHRLLSAAGVRATLTEQTDGESQLGRRVAALVRERDESRAAVERALISVVAAEQELVAERADRQKLLTRLRQKIAFDTAQVEAWRAEQFSAARQLLVALGSERQHGRLPIWSEQYDALEKALKGGRDAGMVAYEEAGREEL